MKTLRFAPLIRVSTEKQAKQGESLRTQKMQIEEVVAMKGGTIPDYCWKYSGQEHATPEQERAKFDLLLKESSKDLYDAVIVVDLSRWSRDNLHSKTGLKILSENRIKFFVLHEELDLNSADVSLRIGLMTEFNEFQATVQKEKSLLNRMERAKRGLPAVGKLPFGRTFDKSNGLWGVDEEKKKIIEQAAKMYLDGMAMPEISRIFGMNHSNLNKILTKRSGDIWEQRFRDERHSIDETVKITVPRLLSIETINRIQEKSKSNKTYTHGIIKYSYLLSRVLFCGECGYSMFGQVNSKKKRYYRHPRNRITFCSCNGLYIPADDIENAVMVIIMRNFMDEVGLQKAIDQATPDENRKIVLIEELETLNMKLCEIDKKKNRLFDAIEAGSILLDDVKNRMNTLKDSSASVMSRIACINSEIQAYPTELQIENARKRINSVLNNRPPKEILERTKRRDEISQGLKLTSLEDDYRSYRRLWEMTFNDKRELLQYLFAGKDNTGKRLGVHVKRSRRGKWHFEVKGIIGKPMKGLSPITDQQARDELGIEDKNVNPFTGEVLNVDSECHAYHRLGFYQ